MNAKLQRIHDLCRRTYDEIVGVPLDENGEGATYEAAAVALAALNQLRDSVFWGDERKRVRGLESRIDPCWSCGTTEMVAVAPGARNFIHKKGCQR